MRTFNGTQTFLTYKEKTGNAGEFSTEELEFETEIQDPDLMHEILIRTGFACVAKIPKHRTSYKLGETRYGIDDYKKIPVLLEFESPSEDILIAAAKELGFSKEQFFLGGTRAVEKHYSIDLNTL
ncbi:MAG: CYTH domain-containing protein [Patescibacteria group bacterium]